MKHQKYNHLFLPLWRRNVYNCHLLLVIISVALSRGTGTAWARAGFSFNFKNNPSKDPALSAVACDDEVVVYQWEEDAAYLEENKPKVLTDDKAKSKPRRIFWMGRLDDGGTSVDPLSPSPGSGSTSSHLLRMEQWDLKFAWKEHKRDRSKAIKFEFNENGYVRCLHPNNNNKSRQSTTTDVTENPRKLLWKHGNNQQTSSQLQQHDEEYVIGTWQLAPSGVTWKMSWDGKTYRFYAELHLNPFGRYPKMFRGLVIRDRDFPLVSKRFMRPIVATFSGKGAGMDRADFSYKNRQVQ